MSVDPVSGMFGASVGPRIVAQVGHARRLEEELPRCDCQTRDVLFCYAVLATITGVLYYII